jgi:hypothetical protein
MVIRQTTVIGIKILCIVASLLPSRQTTLFIEVAYAKYFPLRPQVQIHSGLYIHHTVCGTPILSAWTTSSPLRSIDSLVWNALLQLIHHGCKELHYGYKTDGISWWQKTVPEWTSMLDSMALQCTSDHGGNNTAIVEVDVEREGLIL